MKIEQFLPSENIIFGLSGNQWPEALREMVDYVAQKESQIKQLRDDILAKLLQREHQISTGIGHGVAVPHCYLKNLSRVVAVFGKSNEGVDFDSCDHAPVHFILMLLVPEEQRHQHLQTLADIGRCFSNCQTREALRKATTPAEIPPILKSA